VYGEGQEREEKRKETDEKERGEKRMLKVRW